MDNNKEKQLEQIAQLEAMIKKLPVRWQSAVCWAIEHLDELEEIGRNSCMTAKELQKVKADALAEGDYMMLMLLCVIEHTKESKENEES